MTAAYAPRAADACGQPDPELTDTVPADGETYPANAALLFSGFDLSLEAVTVTVDGQPASLVEAPFAAGFAPIAVTVEPQPQAGQTVVVSGTFCPGEFCKPVTLTYTAGAPDLTAPAPLAEMSFFTVYDHANFQSSGGDCAFDVDLTYYVHVALTAPADGEALALVQAEGVPGDFSGRTRAPGDSATVVMPALESELNGKAPASEMCVRVKVVDTAGNQAPEFEICPACYFRKDDSPQSGSFQAEPAWTDADAVPGSACAVGEESTGDPTSGGTGEPQTGSEGDTGEQDGDKGCACSSDGGPADVGALLVLGLGAGVLRRRR